MNTEHCRSCNAPIFWLLTPAGKQAPADTTLSYKGNGWREEGGQWRLVEASAEAPVHLSHFTTCPDGPVWSKKGKAQREMNGSFRTKSTRFSGQAKPVPPELPAQTALFEPKICPEQICPEQTPAVAPAAPPPAHLTISRATHNLEGDRIRIQVRVQGEILDFDMKPEDFALAVTGLGEVPMTLDRWRGRRVAPTPPPLRPALQRFAEQMEERLAANDHKGGWEHCSLGLLAERLCGEVAELADAPDFQSTAREAVDVANFAMMIADVARKKAQP